jgi:hypothetical protein
VWPAELSWWVPPRKLGDLNCVWFPLHVWCSSDWERKVLLAQVCSPYRDWRRGMPSGGKLRWYWYFFLNYFWLFVRHTRRLPRRGFHGDRRAPVYLLSWGNSKCDYCAFLTSPMSFWVCMCSERLHLLTRRLGKRELWCSQSNAPTGRGFVL